MGRPATASSIEKPGLEAGLGNDGNSSTRWSSTFADDQWWQVDLGSPRNVDRVTINWEIAHASRYQILTSLNGTTFTLAAEQTLTTPTLQTTTFTNRTARYIRIHCNTRATTYGCSFWDANIHGPPDTPPPPNTPPVATFQSPPPSLTWAVGETISFAATATDQEDGTLPASAFSFSLLVQHCPAACHSHVAQTFAGVRSGTFSAPDHDYPSHLELRLTVTDSKGLTDVESVALQPRTAPLTFTSSPSGLQLVVGSTSAATPFTRTTIVGSSTSVAAPSPQTLGATTYGFVSWSDGGAASHNVVTPAAGATYQALFQLVTAPPSSLVAAYGFEEASGTATTDSGGQGNHGTTVGPLRTAAGKYGRALSFDGSNDYVGVADAPSLGLSGAMTIEAWVYPTALGLRGRPVVLKGAVDNPVYDLYAGTSAGRPAAHILVGGREEAVGTKAIPVNTWTHLAATFDGVALTLYVNGSPVGSRPAAGQILGSAEGLRIGGSYLRDWFQGKLDEVRVYSRALNAQEIAADMQTPVTP